MPKSRFDGVAGNKINFSPERLFKIQLETGEGKQAHVMRKIDKQIDIACFFLLIACIRTENSYIFYAVFFRDAKNRRSEGGEDSTGFFSGSRCFLIERHRKNDCS